VGRDGEPGQAYGPTTDNADLDAFKERCADDRHQFRFIVSPEDAEQLDDLRTYTRHLMSRMEADLGTRLDWVAVNHWNTDNPHTHIVLRGGRHRQRPHHRRDYIAHGMRHRAAELATEWLGPRTELEIQQTLQREVEQERWTSLDRTLQRERRGWVGASIERFNEPEAATPAPAADRPTATLAAHGPGRRVAARHLGRPCRCRKTLRAMGERGDIIRTMQRAMSGEPRDWRCSSRATNAATVIGRVAAKGWPTSCTTGAIWSSTGWTARPTTSR
jgi:type IV secretory pathway VirD2 relaxase